MRTFLIEYLRGSETQAEIIRAASSVRAIKALCDKVRKPGFPVSLKVLRVQEVKL